MSAECTKPATRVQVLTKCQSQTITGGTNQMATIRIKLPEITDVSFTVSAEYEGVQIRGNAIDSGDNEYDEEVCNKIEEELSSGNVWAWCTIKVAAEYKGITGEDYLGCCSYSSQSEFEKDVYFEYMKQNAYDDLIDSIKFLSV